MKTDTADALVSLLAPIKKRTEELLGDPAELDRLLAKGAAKAEEVASHTLSKVQHAIGFLKPFR